MTFLVRKDRKGEWRWDLQASEGKVIASSGEGYKDKADCLNAIDQVRTAGMGPPKREPRDGERVALSLRMTPDLKRRLDAVAEQHGRSQSQEAEIRLERSFERQDILSNALTLAYGERVAGLLIALGEVMADVGNRWRWEHGQPEEHWTSDPKVFSAAVQAGSAILTAARPTGVPAAEAEALATVAAMVRALRGKPAGFQNRFSSAAKTIQHLLGPIAVRIGKWPDQMETTEQTRLIKEPSR